MAEIANTYKEAPKPLSPSPLAHEKSGIPDQELNELMVEAHLIFSTQSRAFYLEPLRQGQAWGISSSLVVALILKITVRPNACP